jgi:hypothetical protein
LEGEPKEERVGDRPFIWKSYPMFAGADIGNPDETAPGSTEEEE